jgi:serine/threonine-protein kinase RsbW
VMEADGESGAGAADLHRRDPASIESVSSLRHALTSWAARAGLSREVVEAVTLAGYEALANAVEHAYPGHIDAMVDLHATLSGHRAIVTITDWGRWREPPVNPGIRGRGLILIRKLCTRAEVIATDTGTTVRMTWDFNPG